MRDPASLIAVASIELDRALMARNPDAAASHFTIDARLGESGMPDVHGREAIRAFLDEGDKVRTVVHHRIHRDELQLFGGWAVELGWFEEVKVRHATGERITERGRTMTLWRLDDDESWRIHRIVIGDLPAPDAPEASSAGVPADDSARA